MNPDQEIVLSKPVIGEGEFKWRVMREATREERPKNGDYRDLVLRQGCYVIIHSSYEPEIGTKVWLPNRVILNRFKLRDLPLHMDEHPDICELILKHLL